MILVSRTGNGIGIGIGIGELKNVLWICGMIPGVILESNLDVAIANKDCIKNKRCIIIMCITQNIHPHRSVLLHPP